MTTAVLIVVLVIALLIVLAGASVLWGVCVLVALFGQSWLLVASVRDGARRGFKARR